MGGRAGRFVVFSISRPYPSALSFSTPSMRTSSRPAPSSVFCLSASDSRSPQKLRRVFSVCSLKINILLVNILFKLFIKYRVNYKIEIQNKRPELKKTTQRGRGKGERERRERARARARGKEKRGEGRGGWRWCGYQRGNSGGATRWCRPSPSAQ